MASGHTTITKDPGNGNSSNKNKIILWMSLTLILVIAIVVPIAVVYSKHRPVDDNGDRIACFPLNGKKEVINSTFKTLIQLYQLIYDHVY